MNENKKLLCLDCGTPLDNRHYCPKCELHENGTVLAHEDDGEQAIRYHNNEPITLYSPLSTIVLDYDDDDDEPETCDCGRALREHGEPHPDCQCCPDCETHPCICPTSEIEDEPEDDEQTQRVDNNEDDWKI